MTSQLSMTSRFRIRCSTILRQSIALVALTAGFFLIVQTSSAASKSSARIAIVGTDGQIYTCSGDCSKPECTTCPVKGLQARAESGIRQVRLVQDEGPDQPGPEDRSMPSPVKYGWPTFSPHGSKLAFAMAGRGPHRNSFRN